ncbi:hypothetical protein CBR_g45583 [Chara braunii]|uniref:Uncharacterized protein n=1 Tax=Chara braunii TaxID=69332 RepID=A0A388LZ28_CHABU|nr:hypothetical protein CBR_g45583 [Chara braunii]|eukprot:GBG87525.1 hypothetical protein CBR_g45583 [Chara braunii]
MDISREPTSTEAPTEDKGGKRRYMHNHENMTDEEIEQAEEDQSDSAADADLEDSSEENGGNGYSNDEEYTLEQWIQTVEQLEWGRTIECEIRLAYHKNLRNLKQATQVAEDITTENRFELLNKEEEINEFDAT